MHDFSARSKPLKKVILGTWCNSFAVFLLKKKLLDVTDVGDVGQAVASLYPDKNIYYSKMKVTKFWTKVMKTEGSWTGLKAMGCGKVDRTYNCWFMQVDSDPLGECTGASPATTSASEGSEGTTQPAASQAVKGVGLEGVVVAMLLIAALQ